MARATTFSSALALGAAAALGSETTSASQNGWPLDGEEHGELSFDFDTETVDSFDLPSQPPAESRAGEPRVIWVFFGDGVNPPGVPTRSTSCPGSNKIPPAFSVSWASSEDAKRQIQQSLDRLYADFNVVFTHAKPSGGSFYTITVSDDGGMWCAGRVLPGLGIAPVRRDCADALSEMAFAYRCPGALACSFVIAQEQAHLVGLSHVVGGIDVLNTNITSGAATFSDQPLMVSDPSGCSTTQNSYQLMKQRLGAWPGGDKPGPLPPGGGGSAGGGGAGADVGGGSGGGGAGGGAGGGGVGGRVGGAGGGGPAPGGSAPGGDDGGNVKGGCALGGRAAPTGPSFVLLAPVALVLRLGRGRRGKHLEASPARR